MKGIKQIQQDIRQGKSVKEVVEEYLGVIEEKNQDLNVFLRIAAKRALEQAEQWDEKLRKSKETIWEEKPLLGVPVALKDLFLSEGVETTAGSKVLEGYIPPYSGTVVKRLEEAGAIILGKVNLDAWAHGASGENSDFGATKNPVNPKYSPGGSSSGSAAAIAAGMSPVATGTDTGGSVRLPANFCGVVGLKPTYGRVSRYGVIAMASSLDCMGHLTNTVEDAARVLEVTSGKDRKDANTFKSRPFKRQLSKEIKGKVVGVPKEYFDPVKDEEVKENFRMVREELEEMGVRTREISLPHTAQGISVYYVLMPAEVSSNLARFDGIRYGQGREQMGEEAKRRIMMGTYTLSAGYYDAYYKTALRVRTLIKEDFERAFREVDSILAPVSPTPAFKLGEKAKDPLAMYLCDVLTVPSSLAGLPALALPSGKTKDGLPLGVQIIGKAFEEEEIFPLAYQLEQSINE